MSVLFYNARIWRSGAECYSWMVFNPETGKIVKCGTDQNLPLEECSKKRDMKRQWIFPGFHDCHLHVEWLGYKIGGKNMDLPPTIIAFKEKVLELSNKQDGVWVIGYGWNHDMMDRMPDKADIDEIISDRPAIMFRICQHILVANSKALEIAQITDKTEDPLNGRIDRYPEGHKLAGHPTGVLREDGGVGAMLKAMPPFSTKLQESSITLALQECLKVGLTSVHPCDNQCWKAYRNLANQNSLPIHCYFSGWYVDIDTDNFPSKPKDAYDNLSCECVKVFIDGALNGETAALSEPYLNSDGNKGVLQMTEEEIEESFTRITKAGYRLEIHVIGDRATEITLKYLKKCKVPPESRPLLVHCQILREDLLDEMVKCGVVPTIQPSFVPTDTLEIRNRLPQSLMQCIYPWKTLLKKGIICGGSSDAPIETFDPLQGMYDAIFRPDNFYGGDRSFTPDECLTFQEAVDLYTTGSAYADNTETTKGKIGAGYQADFVILKVPLNNQGEPMDLPKQPELLKSCSVKEVWIKGQCALEN
uniref:Uncharacterized protein LOC100184184 n=1 Tax=Phallusia mammillata TaxID=59560 RepID=A0A6F9DI24_9ASCI|nr:uncharacterized protein LOC100184184 [Phallusia mammillata]